MVQQKIVPKPRDTQLGVGTVIISEAAKRYVSDVLDTGRLSYGPYSRRFEREFARAHDCKHAIFTNSGTSSLQIALAVLKERYSWADGDEVLCPASTFVATSNIILQNNMVPVFVDVDPEIYNLDPAKIEEHITARTRCIIVVHLYGHPAEMDAIMEISRRRGLSVIEDSCETMFAHYKGKSVGSFGEIACFSTYAAHILVTGVGGLNTTNDNDLAVTLRSAMNHGRDSIYLSIDDDKGKQGDELRAVMERRFRFIRAGYSFRATEMEAALGCAQMEDAGRNILARKRNGEALTRRLSQWDKYLQLPTVRPGSEHVFMMFPIVIRQDAPFGRDDITLFLEEHNVETRTMVSILDQPYFQKLFGNDIEERYPVARWIDRNGFYIGCHMGITADDVGYVGAVFDEFFNRHSHESLTLERCGDRHSKS
jgi:dTDP-4-amino-4,6-dideoxygalactose transaminase